MILDQATPVALASAITGLLGVLMLVPWWQERGMRALAWWGAGNGVPQELPNAVLFVACGKAVIYVVGARRRSPLSRQA
jgi:hypothetical protein